jgi:DNA-binding transcriptional ArsR family regulator
MSREPSLPTEVFKALGDPIRWSIIQQMAQEDEVACSMLEDTLPVSKPTISYHTKILSQAGLVEVRKRGRNFFYALRKDVLRELIDELWALAPAPRLVGEGANPERDRGVRAARAQAPATQPPLAAVSGDGDSRPPKLLTW